MNFIYVVCVAAILVIFFFKIDWNGMQLVDPPLQMNFMLRKEFTNLETTYNYTLSLASRDFYMCVQRNKSISNTCFLGKNKKVKSDDIWAEYYMDEPYTKEQQTIHYPGTYDTIIQPKDLCQTPSNPSVLLVIHCGPNQFKERYAVRKTWGKTDSYNGYTFKLVFFMGKNYDDSEGESQLLKEESYIHNDIVQFTHKNTYLNNTITAMLSYKWILKNCPKILYIIKSDLDMYVNIKQIVDYNFVKFGNKTKYNTAIGSFISNGHVIRDMRHKNSIFPEFFPRDYWPTYLSGCLFIYPIDVVQKVLVFFKYIYRFLKVA